MYDNIDIKVRGEAGKVDFLSETTNYFLVTGEHNYKGNVVITGELANFKVSVSVGGVNLTDGSICKYYLGDNFKTLGRGDTKKAIEKLSDTLHLPIDKARISRIDFAQNFIVRQPIENYFNHFGELPYYKRCPMVKDGSLYYFGSKGIVIFYDKVKEQKAKGQPIPELYEGRNVLRYETRYTHRLKDTFEVEKVTGAMLYDEAFYIDLYKRWLSTYSDIKKINDISINFEVMKTKQELYRMGVLALVESNGGQMAVLDQIAEAQRLGKENGGITRKQAYDLKQAINEACKLNAGITMENDAIIELDRKVKEAGRFYR
jgi:hypothetical protein